MSFVGIPITNTPIGETLKYLKYEGIVQIWIEESDPIHGDAVIATRMLNVDTDSES